MEIYSGKNRQSSTGDISDGTDVRNSEPISYVERNFGDYQLIKKESGKPKKYERNVTPNEQDKYSNPARESYENERNMQTYSGSSQEKKENVKTEFAGIVYYAGKMIGFADNQVNGTAPCLNIQKIFNNSYFVAVLTGVNAIQINQDGKLHQLLISEWINDNIKQFEEPYDLCKALCRYMRTNSIYVFGTVTLTAGYYYQSLYPVLFSASFDSHVFNMKIQSQDGPNIWCSGDGKMAEYVNENKQNFCVLNKMLLRSELEKAFESVYRPEKYIKKFWAIYEWNSDNGINAENIMRNQGKYDIDIDIKRKFTAPDDYKVIKRNVNADQVSTGFQERN